MLEIKKNRPIYQYLILWILSVTEFCYMSWKKNHGAYITWLLKDRLNRQVLKVGTYRKVRFLRHFNPAESCILLRCSDFTTSLFMSVNYAVSCTQIGQVASSSSLMCFWILVWEYWSCYICITYCLCNYIDTRITILIHYNCYRYIFTSKTISTDCFYLLFTQI